MVPAFLFAFINMLINAPEECNSGKSLRQIHPFSNKELDPISSEMCVKFIYIFKINGNSLIYTCGSRYYIVISTNNIFKGNHIGQLYERKNLNTFKIIVEPNNYRDKIYE